MGEREGGGGEREGDGGEGKIEGEESTSWSVGVGVV